MPGRGDNETMTAMCARSIRAVVGSAVAAAALMLTACGGAAPQKKAEAPKKVAPSARPMPQVYKVRITTTKGAFVIEVHKQWAPYGAERFWRLVNLGFFDHSKIFRVKRGFVAQFGVSNDMQTNALFNNLPITDDPVKMSNRKGLISFAADGPGTRRTQVFINLGDNKALDKQGFAPFGKVVEGMNVVETFYPGYGEMPPRGNGPDPSKLAVEGNAYAESKFPWLDGIHKATVVN